MSYTTVNGKLVKKGKTFIVPRMSQYETPKLHPEKGLKGGRCNVTACQKPGAFYYNKATQKYYCEDCAEQINWPGGRADVMALYGAPLLCELDE